MNNFISRLLKNIKIMLSLLLAKL